MIPVTRSSTRLLSRSITSVRRALVSDLPQPFPGLSSFLSAPSRPRPLPILGAKGSTPSQTLRAFHSPARAEVSARSLVPIVIQREDRSERSFDIFSRLLRDRVVFVTGEINDEDANIVVAQLLFWKLRRRILQYSVTAGLAIYDTMQYIRCPVHTLCLGQACSMGSVLLAAGAKSHRHALPNASIMIHQPSGGAAGQASDIAIRANEILRVRARLVDIYQHHCGLDNETVEEGRARFERALDRDYYLTSDQAKSFGIVDEVVATRKAPAVAPAS